MNAIDIDKKFCIKCKEIKSFDMFYKAKTKKDGMRYSCKACDYKYAKKWRLKNKDKVREHRKKYRLNNKDKIKELGKKYYIINKDKKKAYHKKRTEKAIRECSDNYIKSLLTAGNSLEYKDIPQELVGAKRQHVKIIRITKEK